MSGIRIEANNVPFTNTVGWFTKAKVEEMHRFIIRKVYEDVGLEEFYQKVTLRQLRYIFKLYDTIFFANRLQDHIDDEGSVLSLVSSDVYAHRPVTVVSMTGGNGSEYKLFVPYNLKNIAKRNTSVSDRFEAYVDGYTCHSTLECYLINFEKTLCALILAIVRGQETYDRGKTYFITSCLCRKLWYHRSMKPLTREQVPIGLIVDIYSKHGTKYRGIVVRKTWKTVSSIVFTLKNGHVTPTSQMKAILGTGPYEKLFPAEDLTAKEIKIMESDFKKYA